MTPSERIDYLILALASDNAKLFADKCGIHPSSLSKLRSGKFHLPKFTGRILAAYPQVNEEWLLSGVGDPIKKKISEKDLVVEIQNLSAKLNRIIELLESGEKKE